VISTLIRCEMETHGYITPQNISLSAYHKEYCVRPTLQPDTTPFAKLIDTIYNMRTASTIFSALALSSTVTLASTQYWNVVDYTVSDDQKILSYTGMMVAPTLPRAGVYYLWPGLQPEDNGGVFQPVLDGRSGGWWFGMGWCCSNPSLAWGGGFPVEADTVLGFNFTLAESEALWKTTITNGQTGQMVDGEFPLGEPTSK
jgi:hypothetical protein